MKTPKGRTWHCRASALSCLSFFFEALHPQRRWKIWNIPGLNHHALHLRVFSWFLSFDTRAPLRTSFWDLSVLHQPEVKIKTIGQFLGRWSRTCWWQHIWCQWLLLLLLLLLSAIANISMMIEMILQGTVEYLRTCPCAKITCSSQHMSTQFDHLQLLFDSGFGHQTSDKLRHKYCSDSDKTWRHLSRIIYWWMAPKWLQHAPTMLRPNLAPIRDEPKLKEGFPWFSHCLDLPCPFSPQKLCP